MAGMIWVSSDASQESLCRLFTQPPLIALWQTRAASANIGTDRIAVAASRSTSSPLAIRVRRSTALARACAKLSFAVEPKRSEEHTSELQSLMRISYAVFCLKKKTKKQKKK